MEITETLVEDTADFLECRDQDVFYQAIKFECLKEGLEYEVKVKCMLSLIYYRQWLMDRHIEEWMEDFCLDILSGKYDIEREKDGTA
jgi:hypothetical protein